MELWGGFLYSFQKEEGEPDILFLYERYTVSEEEEEADDFLINSIHSAMASGAHVLLAQYADNPRPKLEGTWLWPSPGTSFSEESEQLRSRLLPMAVKSLKVINRRWSGEEN